MDISNFDLTVISKLTQLETLYLLRLTALPAALLTSSILPLSLRKLALYDCCFEPEALTFANLTQLSLLRVLGIHNCGIDYTAENEETDSTSSDDGEFYFPVLVALTLMELRTQLTSLELPPGDALLSEISSLCVAKQI